MKNNRAMGFETASVKPVQANPGAYISAGDLILAGDYGFKITHNDATHHLLVVGSTGSGKTESVIRPATLAALRHGDVVVCVDVKGTYTDDVRRMAKACGRLAEVIEFGCGRRAARINLLEGLGHDGIINMFVALSETQTAPNDPNLYWRHAGAYIAADIAMLMKFMAAVDAKYRPTLGRVQELLENWEEACDLYNIFLGHVYDPQNEEHVKLVKGVKNNNFHVLMEKRERRGHYNDKNHNAYERGNTQMEQLTWRLSAIRMALKIFMDTPGVKEHFSAQGGPGLNMRNHIKEGKIISLRLNAGAGMVGRLIARGILTELYIALRETTLEERSNRQCCIVLDEFQDFADLSALPNSDSNMIAIGRQMGVKFIAGTQSLSALGSNSQNAHAANTFAANCNQVVLMFSHDSRTQELASQYEPELRLNHLTQGECLAIGYDSVSRRHAWHIETFNNAFKSCKEVIEAVELEEPGEDCAVEEPVSIYKLVALAAEDAKRFSDSKQAHSETDSGGSGAPASQDSGMAKMFSNVPLADKENYRRKEVASMRDAKKANTGPYAGELRTRFPEMFEDDATIQVPKGWRAHLEAALQLVADSGLYIQISDIKTSRRGLRIGAAGRDSSSGENLLDILLQPVAQTCILCGERLENTENACMEDDADEPSGMERLPLQNPVCGDCLEKYNILRPLV